MPERRVRLRHRPAAAPREGGEKPHPPSTKYPKEATDAREGQSDNDMVSCLYRAAQCGINMHYCLAGCRALLTTVSCGLHSQGRTPRDHKSQEGLETGNWQQCFEGMRDQEAQGIRGQLCSSPSSLQEAMALSTSQRQTNGKGTAGSLHPHLWSQRQPGKSCDKTGAPGAGRKPWVRSRSPGVCPCLDSQGYERVLSKRGGGSTGHLGSTGTGEGVTGSNGGVSMNSRLWGG